MNNKGLSILVIIITILNFLDGITALFVLSGESNPVYLITGNLWMFILGKIILTSIILYVYFKNFYPSNIWYFTYINFLIIGSIAILIGVISNIYGILNPAVVEAAGELTTRDKISYYTTLTTILMVIPLFVSTLTFTIYEKTRKYTRIYK